MNFGNNITIRRLFEDERPASLKALMDRTLPLSSMAMQKVGDRYEHVGQADFSHLKYLMICGCSFGYEQSDRCSAVSFAADDTRFPAEILCNCRLCGGNVRCNSGRSFHQNRKRIAARAMQSRDRENDLCCI